MCTCSLENRNIASQERLLTSCHLKYNRMKTRKNEIYHVFYHFVSVSLRNILRVNLTAVLYSKVLTEGALRNYRSHESVYMTMSTKWEKTQQVVFQRPLKILLFSGLLCYEGLYFLQIVTATHTCGSMVCMQSVAIITHQSGQDGWVQMSLNYACLGNT